MVGWQIIDPDKAPRRGIARTRHADVVLRAGAAGRQGRRVVLSASCLVSVTCDLG